MSDKDLTTTATIIPCVNDAQIANVITNEDGTFYEVEFVPIIAWRIDHIPIKDGSDVFDCIEPLICGINTRRGSHKGPSHIYFPQTDHWEVLEECSGEGKDKLIDFMKSEYEENKS